MPVPPVPPPADRLSIVQALDIVRFPATRDELLAQADREGAFETVMVSLRQAPARTYGSAREVADALAAPVAPTAADA